MRTFTMKAVVLHGTCEAEELAVREVSVPQVRPGWVLVRVRAFGINRSEVLVRSIEAGMEHIKLPRIIGIECVGEIADPSDSAFARGQRVVALMGGMGRSFDGSYAEYALLPTRQVFRANLEMDWASLGAIPETFFTAWGSLTDGLRLAPSDNILVRGGTSALGIAAVQLAKSFGCTVMATTRNKEKLGFLKAIGADHQLLGDGTLADQVREHCPSGVDKVLELVGPATLRESLLFTAPRGVVCVTGILGGQHTLDGFDPIKDIPNSVCLTSFFSNYPTQANMDDIFDHIRRHGITPHIAKVFRLEDISRAHQLMESNRAHGKIVVLT
jgi:NADPH:quinone reductase and related Zn-dependent oxidoreductases